MITCGIIHCRAASKYATFVRLDLLVALLTDEEIACAAGGTKFDVCFVDVNQNHYFTSWASLEKMVEPLPRDCFGSLCWLPCSLESIKGGQRCYSRFVCFIHA